MDKRLRLEHSYHNESVCHYINNNGSFSDWVVTTAFYTSLHFICHHIFPIEFTDPNNKKISLKTIEEYKSYNGFQNDKHSIISDLVYDELPHLSADYDELKDYCMTARYRNYKTKQITADRAIEIMSEIKRLLGHTDTLPPKV